MERKWLWRAIVLVLLLLLSAAASITTFVPAPKGDDKDPVGFLRDLFPGINLGLDLQGGLRLIYEVGVDVAVEDKRDHMAESIKSQLKEKAGIDTVRTIVSDTDNTEFKLRFSESGDLQRQAVKEVLREYRGVLDEQGEDDRTLALTMKQEIVAETEKMSIDQAKETISNRIDKLGLVNTTVIPRHENRDIIIEIPGVNERMTARIKRIIAQTARLELKIVDDAGSQEFFTTGDVREKLEAEASGETTPRVTLNQERGTSHYYIQAKNEVRGKNGRQILEEFMKGIRLPDNRELSWQKQEGLTASGDVSADVTWRSVFTEKVAGITGEYISNAAVAYNETGKPYVSLSFNQEGSGIFADLTGDNVGERMAIILDGRVQSAPQIREKIAGGNAQITLGSAASAQDLMSEARDLVLVLNAGALPAPIRPVTESTVGPQLGEDAIAMGKTAFTVAIIAVLLFMLFYYRGGGIAADLALVCNGVFIMAILGGFQATLTLPGIAGIILTIGMAVDANVIIYERIREELKGGKSPRAAVDAGYKRAFWTIFDAQITTFIAGVVMLQYGTGAIKGFAVTLMIGIVTSMFSAIFVSRLVFDIMTRRRAEQLSI